MTERVPWWQQINEWAVDTVMASPAFQTMTGGDLEQQASEDGIVLSSGPSQYYTPNDPMLYMGRNPMQGSADRLIETPSDRLMPRSEALGSYYAWTSDELKAFQQRAVDAGLVDAADIRFGVRDAMTYSIWQGLVDQSTDAYSAGVRLAPLDLLEEYQQGPTPGTTATKPFTAAVSNPEDIKAQLREFMRETTGTGKIDEAKLDAMVRSWQGEEVAAQRAQYDLAQSGEGGTVTAPRSFESFATEQAKKANPVGFRAHQYLDKFSVIADALGTGAMNAGQ